MLPPQMASARVRVFSNGEEVELFLNNRSLGRHRPEKTPISDKLHHPPFVLKIDKFQPGELRAVAYLAGKPVAQHRVKTPGPVRSLVLEVDTSVKPAAASDLLFVYARVVDADDTVVPDTTNAVTFSTSGDAKLLGENPIAAEGGIESILLKTGDKTGAIHLDASAGGLKGSLELKTTSGAVSE